MSQEIEVKNTEIVVIGNIETDSTSVKLSDSDFYQPKKNNVNKIDDFDQNEEDQQHLEDYLSEPSFFQENFDNAKNHNLLSTDSTTISDSSISQTRAGKSKNSYYNDNTDSTSLESNEFQFDYNPKQSRAKTKTKVSKKPKNSIEPDFLFTRPENNLRDKRKKYNNSDFTNYSSNTPRKPLYTSNNNNNNFTSGHSIYRGLYDPLHIRPTTVKQHQGFEPIPMDQNPIQIHSQKPESNSKQSKSSRDSKSSIVTNIPTQNTTVSPSEVPTPVSGLIVTDISPSPHEIKLEVTADPIQNAMNRLIEYGEIPPSDIQKQVFYMMKREGVSAMINEEYDKAAKMEELQKYLRDLIQANYAQKKSEYAINAIETKIRVAQNELDTETHEWKELLQTYKDRQKVELSKINERHKKEREMYHEKWTHDSMLIPFKKPSSQLIELRKVQKNLALIKNFAEAKAIKQKADELKKLETIEAEKRINQAIRTGYQTLLEKQKREIDCFEEHTRRTCDYISLKMQELIEPIQKLIKSLKTGYPCFYVTEDNSDNRSRMSASAKAKTLPVKKKPIQATPRTKQALVDFRREGEPSKLNINGIMVKEFVHAKRAQSSFRVSRVPK